MHCPGESEVFGWPGLANRSERPGGPARPNHCPTRSIAVWHGTSLSYVSCLNCANITLLKSHQALAPAKKKHRIKNAQQFVENVHKVLKILRRFLSLWDTPCGPNPTKILLKLEIGRPEPPHVFFDRSGPTHLLFNPDAWEAPIQLPQSLKAILQVANPYL